MKYFLRQHWIYFLPWKRNIFICFFFCSYVLFLRYFFLVFVNLYPQLFPSSVLENRNKIKANYYAESIANLKVFIFQSAPLNNLVDILAFIVFILLQHMHVKLVHMVAHNCHIKTKCFQQVQITHNKFKTLTEEDSNHSQELQKKIINK